MYLDTKAPAEQFTRTLGPNTYKLYQTAPPALCTHTFRRTTLAPMHHHTYQRKFHTIQLDREAILGAIDAAIVD